MGKPSNIWDFPASHVWLREGIGQKQRPMANLHSSLQVDNGYYILLQVGSILLFLIHAGHAIGVLSSRIMVGYPHPNCFFHVFSLGSIPFFGVTSLWPCRCLGLFLGGCAGAAAGELPLFRPERWKGYGKSNLAKIVKMNFSWNVGVVRNLSDSKTYST
jgi:hypothetical protein